MAQYCYDYPRPAVTVDIAVFQWREQAIRLLLIQRAREPFAGQWALPGGFVDMQETCARAAARELQEETGLADPALHEVGVFDAPDRDPRGRTISVAYLAILPTDHPARPRSGDDAAAVQWFDVRSLPALAFDHAEVIARTMAQLRRGALYRLDGLNFLPDRFTLPDLHAVYEALLDRPVIATRLQARLQDIGVLEPAGWPTAADGKEAVYQVNRKELAQLRQADALAALAEIKDS